MNVWTITGNLGRDCEVKQLGGSTVCNFSVAVKAGFGNSEQTIWADCALWGKAAEGKLPDYLKKGQSVAVSGELSTYTSQEGKTYLKLRCNSVDLVGGKAEGNHQSQPPSHTQAAPAQSQKSAAMADYEDDIPF